MRISPKLVFLIYVISATVALRQLVVPIPKAYYLYTYLHLLSEKSTGHRKAYQPKTETHQEPDTPVGTPTAAGGRRNRL